MNKMSNKHIVLNIFVLAFVLMLGGCRSSKSGISTETTATTSATQSVEQQREEAKKKRANTIHSIEVLSAVKNDENIYKVNYPWSYFAFDKETMTCNRPDLPNPVAIEKLDSADYEYVMNYIDSIPSGIGDYEGVQSFMVRVYYYDETGEEQSKYIAGFDEFPDGWSEFIDYVNNLCGDDYLSSEGEIVGVTPEFLTEVFGITDEDLKYGTLEDLIITSDFDLEGILYSTFDLNLWINSYYLEKMSSIIEPYKPTSIKTVDSTQEEYEYFATNFLEMLGDGWKEYDSDQRLLRCFYNFDSDQKVYLGRSADLPDMNVWVPHENHLEKYCELVLDYGMEGMVYHMNFYYSKSGKYILACSSGYDSEDYTDIILGFIELE